MYISIEENANADLFHFLYEMDDCLNGMAELAFDDKIQDFAPERAGKDFTRKGVISSTF